MPAPRPRSLLVIGRGVGGPGPRPGRATGPSCPAPCWWRPPASLDAVEAAAVAAAPDAGGRRLGPDHCRRLGGAASRARWPRSGRAPSGWPAWPRRSGARAWCWSGTSPRTATWPDRGRSSTWSTRCSSFEGDRHHSLRILRAVKHRFGADRARWGSSRWATVGWPVWRTPGPCCWATVGPRCPAARWPRCCRAAAAAGRVPGPGLPGPSAARAGPARTPTGWTTGVWPWCWPCSRRGPGWGWGRPSFYVSAAGGVRATEPATDLAAGPGGRLGGGRRGPARGHGLHSVRWVWPARSARCPGWTAAWQRRPAWASPAPSSRRSARPAGAGAGNGDGGAGTAGLRVVGVRTLTEAIVATRRGARTGGPDGPPPAPALGAAADTMPQWSTAPARR